MTNRVHIFLIDWMLAIKGFSCILDGTLVHDIRTSFWCRLLRHFLPNDLRCLMTKPTPEDQWSCKCSPDTWSWYMFYNAFIHVYSPRAGADNPLGTIVDVNRKPLSLCPFVASFKMISSKSDFIHIFNDFIYVHSPGARADNPLGTNFWCQQKALITLPIGCRFKKSCFVWQKGLFSLSVSCKFQNDLFEIWFYTHFLMVLYMFIAPGQGQKTPWGQTFDVSRKPLSLWPFVANFEQISLNSDFIHIF